MKSSENEIKIEVSSDSSEEEKPKKKSAFLSRKLLMPKQTDLSLVHPSIMEVTSEDEISNSESSLESSH